MTKGPDSKFTKTMGVRIQCDEAQYIRDKAQRENQSISAIIRDYVTWGIERDEQAAEYKGQDIE